MLLVLGIKWSPSDSVQAISASHAAVALNDNRQAGLSNIYLNILEHEGCADAGSVVRDTDEMVARLLVSASFRGDSPLHLESVGCADIYVADFMLA